LTWCGDRDSAALACGRPARSTSLGSAARPRAATGESATFRSARALAEACLAEGATQAACRTDEPSPGRSAPRYALLLAGAKRWCSRCAKALPGVLNPHHFGAGEKCGLSAQKQAEKVRRLATRGPAKPAARAPRALARPLTSSVRVCPPARSGRRCCRTPRGFVARTRRWPSGCSPPPPSPAPFQP
jgi:hypothetical protein